MSDKNLTPPHSVEAERIVIGCILADPQVPDGGCAWDVCQSKGVVADAFYDPRNREIFGVLEELGRENKPMNCPAVLERLRTKKRLEAIGGAVYLQGAIDSASTTADAGYYSNIVRDKYIRRVAIKRFNEGLARAYDEENWPDVVSVVGKTEESLMSIGVQGAAIDTWGASVKAESEKLIGMAQEEGQHVEGLLTGFKPLDNVLLGLKNGEVIVIAARPSVGKTALAMNIVANVAATGKRVLVFSLEMPRESLVRRALAAESGVDLRRLAQNNYPKEEKDGIIGQLEKAGEALARMPVYVDDSGSLDIAELCARARRMVRRHDIDLVVVDYLQLAECREAERQGIYAVVTKVSKQMKALAKKINRPVITLSQLSRAAGARDGKEDGGDPPTNAQLRESGAIEQDADVIMLLHYDMDKSKELAGKAKNDPNRPENLLTVVNVSKNRNGSKGEVELIFEAPYARFRVLEEPH